MKRTRAQKLLRFVGTLMNPGCYVHLLRVMNLMCVTGYRERRKVNFLGRNTISPVASFTNGERITIGDRSAIGDFAFLIAGQSSGRIVLGEDVMIAPGVLMTSANYDVSSAGPMNAATMKESDIHIGNDVWVGTGAVILAGVTIGDHSVVAANAVVTKDMPPWSIIAGIPGRVIAERCPDRD